MLVICIHKLVVPKPVLQVCFFQFLHIMYVHKQQTGVDTSVKILSCRIIKASDMVSVAIHFGKYRVANTCALLATPKALFCNTSLFLDLNNDWCLSSYQISL